MNGKSHVGCQIKPSEFLIPLDLKLAGPYEIVTRHIAAEIILLCQEKKSWCAFEYSELKVQCRESDALISRSLQILINLKHLCKYEGKYLILHAFIEACSQDKTIYSRYGQ